MTASTADRTGIVEQSACIAQQIAVPAADDVDRHARFPHETFDALRSSGLLGALIPAEFGGLGAPLGDVGASVTELASVCSSSGMILAMHHLQVACLVRHGDTAELHDALGDIARDQLLLASATTEKGVGGSIRESICAIAPHEDGYQLVKEAAVISYGSHADGVLATARRGADRPPSDQVLVLCRPPGLALEQTGAWDTLGMRGTCSPGFILHATGSRDLILSDPFAQIAEQTMLPVSHILWGCVWLGIATAAVGRARTLVRSVARKNPDAVPREAPALAELMLSYRQLESLVHDSIEQFDRLDASGVHHVPMAFTISMNALKVAASRLVIDVVSGALTLCGMAGYAQGSPFSLGRQLRDAYSAAVMINNSRILAENAHMLAISKG